MANRVLTIFEGQADSLFSTADRVEKRLEDFAKNTSNLQASPTANAQAISPVLQSQKQLTDGVQREADRRVAIEQDAGRKIVENAKRTASETSQAQSKAYNPNDPAVVAEIAEKRAASIKRIEEKQTANAADAAAKRTAIAEASEAKQALVAKAARESEIKTQVASNIAYNKARRERLAEAKVFEEAETAFVRREAVQRNAARRGALFGENSLAGGAARGAGLGGIAVGGPAAIAGFVAAAGIVNAVKSFEDANQRSLQLRANLEGLGLEFRKVGADARAFAERHSQDVTTINDKYAEFVKLSRSQGQTIEDIGRKAIDIGSKRQLSDAQLIEGLKNISKGIADETLLGVSGATAITEYAAAHGVAADQLTVTQKAQVAFNEYLRQGNLAAGDHKAQVTELTSATTLLGNAWETANVKLGTFIDNFLKNPELALALFAVAPSKLLNTSLPSDTPPDPAAAAQAEAARQRSVANNQLALARAEATAPNERSVVDLALTKFVDRGKFLSPDADVAAKAKADAIKAAQDEVQLTVSAYRDSIKSAEGDIKQSQLLLKGLFSVKGLIDPAEFKSLSDTLARQISSAITAAYQQRQQRQASANNLAEAQLQNHLVRMEATEIQSIERTTDLRQRQIQDQINADRAYYGALIANAQGNLPEIRRLNDELNTSIITKTNEMKANALRAEAEILQKRRELLQESRSMLVGFAGQQNPYVRIADEGARAFERIAKIERDLGKNIGNTLRGAAKEANDFALATQRISDGMQAFDLLDRARNLRRGFDPGDEDSIRERAKRELFPNYSSPEAYNAALERQVAAVKFREQRELQQDLDKRLQFAQSQNPIDRRAADQGIIRATASFRPGELTPQQREIAARANENEARAVLEAQQKASNFHDAMMKLIGDKGLKVDPGDAAITKVEVTAPQLQASKRSVYGRPVSTADSMLP